MSLLPPILRDQGPVAPDLAPAPAPAPVHPTELAPLPGLDTAPPPTIPLSPPAESFTMAPSPGAAAPWLAGDPAPLLR
ncbi:MAG: MotA/TolQ/ExbB proton channel family protein, partial [Zavarzinia sp.]